MEPEHHSPNIKRLNLGCGSRFHPEWTNLDFVSASKDVIAHDLRKGIPYFANEFDVVYHSHVLEHFKREEARAFIGECVRVLKPGGILRVVVPNLERLAKAYLAALTSARENDSAAKQANHEWTIVHLYDQAVREFSGGIMKEFLSQETIANEDFVIQQVGVEAKKIIEVARQSEGAAGKGPRSSLIHRMWHLLRRPHGVREAFVKRLFAHEYEALAIGRFRQSGEVHKWMYDGHSLGAMLEATGLTRVCVMTSLTSSVPDWGRFRLDVDVNGNVFRPDSLFMEASKPKA
jgi:predicted SAM-dependent methyltransferase